jgi:hypothetical protein
VVQGTGWGTGQFLRALRGAGRRETYGARSAGKLGRAGREVSGSAPPQAAARVPRAAALRRGAAPGCARTLSPGVGTGRRKGGDRALASPAPRPGARPLPAPPTPESARPGPRRTRGCSLSPLQVPLCSAKMQSRASGRNDGAKSGSHVQLRVPKPPLNQDQIYFFLGVLTKQFSASKPGLSEDVLLGRVKPNHGSQTLHVSMVFIEIVYRCSLTARKAELL